MAAGLFFFVEQSFANESLSPKGVPGKWKVYRDITRGYKFWYPPDYKLKEGLDYKGMPYGYNLLEGKDGQLIEVDADYYTMKYVKEFISEQLRYFKRVASLEDFAVERAKMMYAADGPDGSQYATDVVKKKVFRNPNNLEIIELYLTVVEEYYPEHDKEPKIEKTTEGPIYVVFISKGEAHIKFLFLRFINNSKSDIPQDKEVLRKIVNTVRILQ